VLYERILVGTDGSASAALAVDRAVGLAAATGASLTIFCVGNGEPAQATVAAEAQRHATSGVAITTATAPGDPATVLVDTAQAGRYSLVVVGNKGMTGAARFLLGSVPNKVSHHAHCNVLIVRTT
jgi:nucleotide-binding universal stress UspA family protein